MHRRDVLRANQAAREGRIEARHAPFAEHVLRIPESDFPILCRLYPGLNSKNADEQRRAVDKFLASEASAPYRVRRLVRGVRR
jgi:hypothetical protein